MRLGDDPEYQIIEDGQAIRGEMFFEAGLAFVQGHIAADNANCFQIASRNTTSASAAAAKLVRLLN